MGLLSYIIDMIRNPDPYRRRLDRLTWDEAGRLYREGKLTVKEVERIQRIQAKGTWLAKQ